MSDFLNNFPLITRTMFHPEFVMVNQQMNSVNKGTKWTIKRKKNFLNYKIWEEKQVLKLYQKELVKFRKVETKL